MSNQKLPLVYYLAQQYRFAVIADPDGGYVIEYPDLPGCMTQVETVEEVGGAAKEIFEIWMEAAHSGDLNIPDPVFPETYSGKFVLRLPKSLHRRLSVRANLDGVSLNQLAVSYVSEGLGRVEAGRRLERIIAAASQPDGSSRLSHAGEDSTGYE